MADEAKDILEKSFGKEKPLTEEQKEIRRNAAAFAIGTFSDTFRKPESIKNLNVSLTDEQIRFAENLASVFPKPEDVLPESEFNSARAGYSRLVATPMYEVIPASLNNSISKFGKQYDKAKELLKKDPSGILYIQSLLLELEEKARHGKNVDIDLKEMEFKNNLNEIFDEAQIYSDKVPPEKPLDDQSPQENLIRAILKAFSGSDKTPRDKFLIEKRHKLHEEIPLEFDRQTGKAVATDKLTAMGARLAFDQYQKAVNIYLNRWGKQD